MVDDLHPELDLDDDDQDKRIDLDDDPTECPGWNLGLALFGRLLMDNMLDDWWKRWSRKTAASRLRPVEAGAVEWKLICWK